MDAVIGLINLQCPRAHSDLGVCSFKMRTTSPTATFEESTSVSFVIQVDIVLTNDARIGPRDAVRVSISCGIHELG